MAPPQNIFENQAQTNAWKCVQLCCIGKICASSIGNSKTTVGRGEFVVKQIVGVSYSIIGVSKHSKQIKSKLSFDYCLYLFVLFVSVGIGVLDSLLIAANIIKSNSSILVWHFCCRSEKSMENKKNCLRFHKSPVYIVVRHQLICMKLTLYWDCAVFAK